MKVDNNCRFPPGGFTLVELLVVVLILVVLMGLALMGFGKVRLNAEKTKALGQMRDISLSLEAYIAEYGRPPIPDSKREGGWDVIYGDPGGLYSTASLIGSLMGEDRDTEYETNTDEVFHSRDLNPRGNPYLEPRMVDNKRYGVDRTDGKLYDPWGREMMIATNTPPFEHEKNGGQKDRHLETWGLAVWSDKEPREEPFALWSYGKNGEKGESLAGSDDVAYW